MAHTENKIPNDPSQPCSYARIMGYRHMPELCMVSTIFEGLEVCYGCGKFLSVIPEDCQGIFEQSYRARELMAQFISGEINDPSYRPLSFGKFIDRKDMGHSYALMVGGDPDCYGYITWECPLGDDSGHIGTRVTQNDLLEAVKSVPMGLEFRRDLVESVVGPISDAVFRAALKVIAMGFSYMGATPATHDSYSRLRFCKGHERRYGHPDGNVRTVRKGVTITIEW